MLGFIYVTFAVLFAFLSALPLTIIFIVALFFPPVWILFFVCLVCRIISLRIDANDRNTEIQLNKVINNNKQIALNPFVKAIWGDDPPEFSADIDRSIMLAFDELLQKQISYYDVKELAYSLGNGEMPYNTEELALSVAFNFLIKDENLSKMIQIQMIFRLKMVEWVKNGKCNPLIAQSFETVLYEKYKPVVGKNDDDEIDDNDDEILSQVTTNLDIDDLAIAIAHTMMEKYLYNSDIAYDFIMQELDGARQGNYVSRNFVENSGFNEYEYKNTLHNDTPNLDEAQDIFMAITYNSQPTMDLRIELKLKTIDLIMKFYELGKYSD